MDRAALLARFAQTEEDRVLFAHILDRVQAGERKNIPAVTCFLTPRERALAERMLSGMPVRFFGGVPEAERTVCCYLPDYLDDSFLTDGGTSPVCAVRAEFYAPDALTHRDFLGALMGCGVKRETVGDILVGEGKCDFFVTREILPYLLQNLESAGRSKLRLEQISLSEAEAPAADYRELRAVVASLRLDSVVSAAFGLSRTKAAEAVEQGKVFCNDLPCGKPDRPVEPGDRLVLRGMGKAVLAELGGKTKKDRQGIVLHRYG